MRYLILLFSLFSVWNKGAAASVGTNSPVGSDCLSSIDASDESSDNLSGPDRIERLKRIDESIQSICRDLSSQELRFSGELKKISSSSEIPEIEKNVKSGCTGFFGGLCASKKSIRSETCNAQPRTPMVCKIHFKKISRVLQQLNRLTNEDNWRDFQASRTVYLRLRDLEKNIKNNLQGLSYFLFKVNQMLPCCKEKGLTVQVSRDVKKIPKIKKDIINLLTLDFYSGLTDIDLSYLCLRDYEDGNDLIESLPLGLKILNLYSSEITSDSLKKLSRCLLLEELNLKQIVLTTREDWVEVIQYLPTSIKKLRLSKSNINKGGLRELSRLKSLEALDVSQLSLANNNDGIWDCITLFAYYESRTVPSFSCRIDGYWECVIKALPIGLKELNLDESMLDTPGLLALSRLKDLESLHLGYTRLSSVSDWLLVVRALPDSINSLSLGRCDIDVLSLTELTAKLKMLEYIDLSRIWFSNPGDWKMVLEQLSSCIQIIILTNTGIIPSGTVGLKNLESLESIALIGSHMSGRDWELTMQYIPKTLKRIYLAHSNIGMEGLLVLAECFRDLEIIYLDRVCLDSVSDWIPVMQSLTEKLQKISLLGCNIPANALCYLKAFQKEEEE